MEYIIKYRVKTKSEYSMYTTKSFYYYNNIFHFTATATGLPKDIKNILSIDFHIITDNLIEVYIETKSEE